MPRARVPSTVYSATRLEKTCVVVVRIKYHAHPPPGPGPAAPRAGAQSRARAGCGAHHARPRDAARIACAYLASHASESRDCIQKSPHRAKRKASTTGVHNGYELRYENAARAPPACHPRGPVTLQPQRAGAAAHAPGAARRARPPPARPSNGCRPRRRRCRLAPSTRLVRVRAEIQARLRERVGVNEGQG